MRKMHGGTVSPLPVSSVKQIAGRAGRYGLHEVDAGGTTTTLFPSDLGLLRQTLPLPYQPLSFARVGTHAHVIANTLSILPPGTTIYTAVTAAQYVGRLPYYMRYMEFNQTQEAYNYIDAEWRDMSIDDKVQILYAPVPWRDEITSRVVKRLLSTHQRDFTVTLEDITRGEVFIQTLENVERQINREETQGSAQPLKGKQFRAKYQSALESLSILESFHKVLVFYTWMSLRNSVVYSDMTVPEVKERLEKVLNWALVDMSRDVTLPVEDGIPHIKAPATKGSKDVPPALIIPEMLNEVPECARAI